MIDPDKIIADALSLAQADKEAEYARRSDLISLLTAQRAALDAQIAQQQQLNADTAADVVKLETAASSLPVLAKP